MNEIWRIKFQEIEPYEKPLKNLPIRCGHGQKYVETRDHDLVETDSSSYAARDP